MKVPLSWTYLKASQDQYQTHIVIFINVLETVNFIFLWTLLPLVYFSLAPDHNIMLLQTGFKSNSLNILFDIFEIFFVTLGFLLHSSSNSSVNYEDIIFLTYLRRFDKLWLKYKKRFLFVNYFVQVGHFWFSIYFISLKFWYILQVFLNQIKRCLQVSIRD